MLSRQAGFTVWASLAGATGADFPTWPQNKRQHREDGDEGREGGQALHTGEIRRGTFRALLYCVKALRGGFLEIPRFDRAAQKSSL